MPASTAPRIKSRKPTGQVAYPLILIEGPEKAGKSLIPVVLSTSERVGTFYWLDLGEGAADEYAALPGSNYEVIEHDGSYRDILEQITAVHAEATRAAEAGEPPVGIVVDSMSALWAMLVNWTNDRARRSRVGQRKLAEDPDAEIDPTSNLWNDANKRHARVMDLLMKFPGIAIVTARGKEVSVIGPNGAPIEGRKEWKVEGQKQLAFDASAWIRLSRSPRTAELIGARSLRLQVPEGRTMTMPMRKVGSWDVCDLETFIFDTLGCTPGNVHTRDLQKLRGDALQGMADEVLAIHDEQELRAYYEAKKVGLTPPEITMLEEVVFPRATAIREAAAAGAQRAAAPPQEPTEPTLPVEEPAADEAPADDRAAALRAAAARRQEAHA